MAIITGKNAIIDGAAGVGFWKIDYSSSDAAVVHSGTEGAAVRVAGNLDWRGVYQSYGHTPQAMPGGALSFVGEASDDSGASGTAIVERVDIHWDIAEARPIYHNVHFAANGALAFHSSTESPTAATYAAPVPSKAMLTKWGVSTVPNVTKMMLTLVSKNAPYVDSSTAGQVQRIAGNTDVFWMYRRNLDDPTTLPTMDAIAQLQFFVNATYYWDIQDAIVKRITPIYEIEGGKDKQLKVVAATVAGKLGIDPADATHEVISPATAAVAGTNFIDFTD